jgi:hypothetical protein
VSAGETEARQVKGLRAASWETQADRRQKAPLRRAQWSSYFLRFFGMPEPGDSIPAGVLPVSPEDSADVLHRTFCGSKTEKTDRRARYLVRRCVSQMLLRGYQPRRRKSEVFDQLVKSAAEPRPDDTDAVELRAGMDLRQATDLLVRWGQREFGMPGPVGTRIGSVDQALEAIRQAGPGDRTISVPTQIIHESGTTSVIKQVFLRQDLALVNWLVNPLNWNQLGEFFAVTKREADGSEGPTLDATPWYGVLVEEFVVSWNSVSISRFNQRLKVDYSVLPDLARTDYSLMYEEKEQIEVNEGFFEVRKVKVKEGKDEKDTGWIAGTMKKTVRFKSSILNFLAPATLAMFLDSKTGGFGRFVDFVPKTEEGSASQPVP